MKVSRRIITTILFSVLISTVLHLPCILYAEEAMVNQTAPEGEPLPVEPDPTDGEVVPKAAASSETTDEPGSGLKVALPEAMQFTGASTYKYPIEVPPGRAGIAPQIALAYNSQARNSWLGVGWTLDMGSIQRNTKFGLNYTDDVSPNAFVASINGGSADLVPRTDWGAGYWGAKVEGSFSKYQFQNNAWIVTAKDGTKYYYGSTVDSRQTFASGTFKWCLDRVEDTNGNFMTLTYWKDTSYGEIYLDRIYYTGNINSPTLPTTNYVEFIRDNGTTRLDAPNMYTTNNAVKTRYRLSAIKTYANGQPVRTYTITYGTSPDIHRSRIYSITQYGSDGTSTLPPVSFTYHGTSASFGMPTTWPSQTHYRTNTFNWVCDVDGDGKQDIVTWENSTSIKINFGSANGFVTQVWPGTFKQYDGIPLIWVGDFNGDGTCDIATRENSTMLRIHLGNETRGGFKEGTPQMRPAELDSNTKQWVGDFNGDGKADLMSWDTHASPDGSRVRMHITNDAGTGFNQAYWSTNFYKSATWGVMIWLGDFNGDGRTDVMAWDEDSNPDGSQVIMHLSTGSGFSQSAWGSNFYKSAGNGVLIRLGDFNGDGKTDVMAYDEDMPEARAIMHLSKGIKKSGELSGFIQETWPATLTKNVWGQMYWAGDFNGDGMTDIISRDSASSCTMQHSTGSSFDRKYNWLCDLKIIVDYGPQFLFGDFNGDGRYDIVSRENSTQAKAHYYSTYTPTDAMATAANGIGGTSTIAYLPSSDRLHPDKLSFVVPTVDRITVNDGNGISSVSDYDYEGGLYAHIDREFYGFGYAKLTNPIGTTSETWFKQREATGIPNRYKGLPERQITKNSSGLTFVDAVMTYATTTPATNVAFPYLQQKDEFIFDGYPTFRQARTFLRYDGYGNVTDKEMAEVIDDQGNTQDKRYEYTEYSNDTIKWVFNRPVHAWVTNTNKQGPKKAESWFTYDTRWNLLTKTAWLAGGVNPTVSSTYNQYGNQVTATDARNYTTTMEYDTTKTYVVRTTNPKNHTVDATWDYKYGKPLTKTIPHLASDPGPYPKTVYTYDVFGRLSTVTLPGYSTPSVQYQYANFGAVGQQRVIVLLPFNLWKETFFDGLGRTIYTRKPSADPNVPILTKTEYNTIGQTARQSTPCFANGENKACLGTTYWTTFGYDAIGRVNQTNFPDTTTSRAFYSQGETTLVNANGRVKLKEKDIHGRLVRVVEYTGLYPNHAPYATTQYTYDTLGNLTDVIDAHGNHTIIAYDTLSRKTTMQDPDMGIWNYGYDANGNLTSQTDAKNKTITFTYDQIGRVTLKNYNDPLVTNIVYTYDEPSSTYPVGRLTTVTDGSGNTRFSYDQKGRTTQTIKTIGTTPYTTSTNYDILDRTTSITYPNATVVNYTYDGGGNLLEVSSGSTIFARYEDYTALGQTGEILYGNLAQTTYQYNSATSRLATLTTTGSTVLQNLSYGYDNVGNVTAIDDFLDRNRDQDFIYDHLNRLTQAQSPVYGTLTYQYNQIGNTTYNSQVGTYAYPAPGSARPHAVSQAGSISYVYDANGNMTSGNGRTLAWTRDNKPSSITAGGTTTTFTYDYSGKRVKKIASQTTVYPSSLYECIGSTCTAYIFGNGKRIAKVTGSTTLYIHGDHLGSATIMTNQTGTKVRETYYYPYGQTRITSGTQDDKHKFTDQEEDTETGLYNFNARHYDPILGRFVSPDSIVQNYEDPQTLNRYSYCGNNPLVYVDPSGHFFIIDDLIYIGIGMAIGALTAGIQSDWNPQAMAVGAAIGGISGGVGAGVGGYVGGQVGSQLAGVVAGGAAAGATAGGLNAAYYGGNIGDAMLKGAAGGALGGLVGYGIGLGLAGLPDPLRYGGQVLGGGLIGGGLQELFGGHFSDGFMTGAIGAAASLAIYEVAKNSNAKSSQVDQYKSEAEANLVVNESPYLKGQECIVPEVDAPEMHAGGFTHFFSTKPFNPWDPAVGTEGPWFAPWKHIVPPQPRPGPVPWWRYHPDPPHPEHPHEKYGPIAFLLDGDLQCV